MSDAKTQHQLPTPYPETSFGIAVRHSGEPMVARNRSLTRPVQHAVSHGQTTDFSLEGPAWTGSILPAQSSRDGGRPWEPTCGCPGTAAAVSFHQTTNLCLQNLQRSPSNAVLALLDKLEHVTWTAHIRTSARSGLLSLAHSIFSPPANKSDMVGLLLHLSGCAIIDPFVSSRN